MENEKGGTIDFTSGGNFNVSKGKNGHLIVVSTCSLFSPCNAHITQSYMYLDFPPFVFRYLKSVIGVCLSTLVLVDYSIHLVIEVRHVISEFLSDYLDRQN